MNIAVIIIGIDGWDKYTLPLVQSINKHEPDCFVVVVDNDSQPPYPNHRYGNDIGANCNDIRIKRSCYSRAINIGKGTFDTHDYDADWYVVLSNDVLCTGPFAHILEQYTEGDLVGPCLKEVLGLPYLEGWFVAIPRATWDAVGGWDEAFLGSDWEDADISTTARERGYGLQPDTTLPFVHLDQKQRFYIVEDFAGKNAHNQALFMQKHAGKVKGSATVSQVLAQDSLCVHDIQVGNLSLKIQDYSASMTTAFVLRELGANVYGLNGRTFEDGAVIVDIGANVGIVTIWLAKQLPNVRIYAYEPLPVNYANLVRNLELNGVTNVVAVNAAVTKDGRDLTMHFNFDNLGGASGITGTPPWHEVNVPSVTLQGIFEAHGIERAAFVKMDCEGAEHEILASCNGLLQRVDFLGMEAHFSQGLRRQGFNERTLERALRPLIERKAVASMAQEVPG